ncbi:MAG: hypothetical protein M3285_13480 [Actinomycetota bacterium]|nr:hypothetical protein [Actinomycetota bacterium]
MPADPRRSLQDAAAQPQRPPDIEAIQKRGRRLRGLRVVGALGVVVTILFVATATVALVDDDRKELPPAETGPSASPGEDEFVTHEKGSSWPFRVRVPADWYWAEESLTPKLVDPRELFATGTFPPEFRRTDCSHLPGSALRDVSSSDAFVTVQERLRGSQTYPDRPADFRAEARPAGGLECVPEDAAYDTYWIPFNDEGRAFYALLVIGKDARDATRDDAWATLNSFTSLPWEPTDPPGAGEESGGRIAFLSARGDNSELDLFTIRPDGSGLRQVTDTGFSGTGPVWSPGGNHLLVARGLGEGASELVILDAATGEYDVVLTDDEDERLLNPQSPAWSPDARTIAFASSAGEIYVIERDSTGLERLFAPEGGCGAQYPEWSPEGTRLAYTLDCPGGGIFSIDIDGTDVRRVTGNRRDLQPAWSPDGDLIAFSRDGEQIYVTSASGAGGPTALTEEADNYEPDWAPDGSAIVFGSNRSGRQDIYVMDADGEGERALTDDPAPDYAPDWGP